MVDVEQKDYYELTCQHTGTEALSVVYEEKNNKFNFGL